MVSVFEVLADREEHPHPLHKPRRIPHQSGCSENVSVDHSVFTSAAVLLQSQTSADSLLRAFRRVAILTCEKCGAEIPERTSYCVHCGTQLSVAHIGPVIVPPPTPAEAPAAPEIPAAAARVAYAGFWLRAIAYLIDTILVSLVLGFVASFYPAAFVKPPDAATMTSLANLPQLTPTAFVATIAGVWLYYTLFEASPWQATPGKRMLRLYVADIFGRRLTFGRAAARNAAKLISSLTFLVGYLVAGFTPRKQALHDILASCLVLRGR